MEYKEFELEVKHFMEVDFEIKQGREDEDEDGKKVYRFEGYLSTFNNIDRGDDVILPGAFAESLKTLMPALLGFHKSDEPPLGIFEKVYEDEKGLYVHGLMPLDDVFVRERIVPQMEIGSLKSMSIGYSVTDASHVKYEAGIRYLKQVKLWEGSLVTIPMNELATIKGKAAVPFQDSLPIAPRNTMWDQESALGRVQEWAGVDENSIMDPDIQQRYARAFLWYDDEDPDVISWYRLQIADVINGELTIVPRAVFMAAAILRGARGGARIFERDRARVTRTVERYYEKMGLPSPFTDNGFRIDEFRGMDPRTLEKIFRTGISTDKKNAKMLVAFIKHGFKREAEELKKQRDVVIEPEVAAESQWDILFDSVKQLTKIMEI